MDHIWFMNISYKHEASWKWGDITPITLFNNLKDTSNVTLNQTIGKKKQNVPLIFTILTSFPSCIYFNLWRINEFKYIITPPPHPWGVRRMPFDNHGVNVGSLNDHLCSSSFLCRCCVLWHDESKEEISYVRACGLTSKFLRVLNASFIFTLCIIRRACSIYRRSNEPLGDWEID